MNIFGKPKITLDYSPFLGHNENMAEFYTYCWQYGKNVLTRGYRDGKPFTERDPSFKPKLYVRSKEDSGIKGLYGENLQAMEFPNAPECREFIQTYDGIGNYPIYGQTDFTYQYLSEKYPDEVPFDMSQMGIWSLDIETSTEFGFPNVDNPLERITLITVMNNNTKEIFTWGEGNWTPVSDEVKNLNVTYEPCEDEVDLLNKFGNWWVQNTPDIVTGWNIEFFDIPYLMNRFARVLGKGIEQRENKVKNSFSPFDMTRRKQVTIMGKEHTLYDIKGVSQLDYLDLYKKFTYTVRESYKLDYIAEVELGHKKLENKFDTFREFYENDWNRFVDYNIVDTQLVDELEDKMKLIELIATMAYDAKCNLTDIYSSVRTWDCLLYNHLLKKNIMIPQKRVNEGRTIEGAYVQQPEIGEYDWVLSFDATSLYPSIIMQYNMSPETLVEEAQIDTTVDRLLDRETKVDTMHAMAANGAKFTRDKQGVFAEITQTFFDDRQKYKKLMKEAEREYEKTKDPSLKSKIAKYNNFQMARKIQLNSLYGALANQYFRYYDDKIAEGITLSGQFIIRETAKALDEYLNKVCGTEGEVYSFYSDTDSCYISLDKMVKKYYSGLSKEKIVDVLDKIAEEKIEPAINKAMKKLADYTNAYEEKIFFKREAIADRGIWVAKKRYALNVWDNEGVRYDEPKLKVMGLEIVRSSTPAPVRESLREAVKLCLTQDEAALQKFVEDNWQDFKSRKVEEIAFPRGCNNLTKYTSTADIYQKGTPIQVRGALLYNNILRENKLEMKYSLINEGDKIKFVYLKEPNTLGENVISFASKVPEEFDLHKYIDYELMFEKAFIEPLNTNAQSIGWKTKAVATLEDLFS
jgi:DNA polymerase elongation subunit (family B)